MLFKLNPCPQTSHTNFSSLWMYLCLSSEVCVLNPICTIRAELYPHTLRKQAVGHQLQCFFIDLLIRKDKI